MAKPLIMVGVSAATWDIRDEIDLAARSDASLLISGERGVGKDLVGRLVHQASPRAAGPLITISCAGRREAVLEPELFGRGIESSLTGADMVARSRLEEAHGGTLFLHGVCEMSVRLQALFLRFLEIQRVESNRHFPPDVRVIAATPRRLLDAVADGTFREDLYYRLNVTHIEIPPLRDRREDVPVLLDHFLHVFADAYERPVLEVTPDALSHLIAYRWPGNVRELENLAERLVLKSRTERIDVETLPSPIIRAGKSRRTDPPVTVSQRSFHEKVVARIVQDTETFWSGVYEPFMKRDLTGDDVRAIVRLGLERTQGDHEWLKEYFKIADRDCKRFADFLHSCGCDVPLRRLPMASAKIRQDLSRRRRASA